MNLGCEGGGGASVLQLQELALIDVEELHTADPKASSWAFLAANGDEKTCHFESVEAVNDAMDHGRGCECWRHQGQCQVRKACDLFVAGFPCAPFSERRNERFAAGRWRILHDHNTMELALSS